MSASASSPSAGPGPLEDRIRSVSPLWQIESHTWDEKSWADSEALLDRVEAEIALARGRLIYERFLRSGPGGHPSRNVDGRPALPLFRRAAELFHRAGDPAREREALFWVGTLEQTLERNYSEASVTLERAGDLAKSANDLLVQSCVERHLGFLAFLEGVPLEARAHLEESVRLRREIPFPAGVAMGLVAIAELALEEKDRAGALRALDEAAEVARAAGASGALAEIGDVRQRASGTK
jgi:tetratricopeptide (TPR) repeat protein